MFGVMEARWKRSDPPLRPATSSPTQLDDHPHWRYLHDQSLEALPEADVQATRITLFGVGYEVIVMIDSLNGATQPVVTTWIIEGDRPPRLTSPWVDIPKACENQPAWRTCDTQFSMWWSCWSTPGADRSARS